MSPTKAVFRKRAVSGTWREWPLRNTLVLKNTGLVARDHLANERTYLAWTRTALVMMTLGLAFLQLYSIQLRAHEAVYKNIEYEMDSTHGVSGLRTTGKPFGVLIGVFALITAGVGFYRYMAVQQRLQNGEFPASRFLVAMVLGLCGVLMVLILVMDIKSL